MGGVLANKKLFHNFNMSEITRYQTLEVYGIQNDIRSKSQHTENKLNFVELPSTKRSDLVFFRVKSPSDKKYQAVILIKMTTSLYRC